MNKLTLIIPLVPPSGNHYKGITRTGRTYVKKEAKAFFAAVAAIAAGRKVEAKAWTVGIRVWLGPKQRGDADNFNKVVLDSLVHAKIINDAKVYDGSYSKRRSRSNPRTEIVVRSAVVPKEED